MPPEGPHHPTADTTGQPSWLAPFKPVVPDHELLRRIGGGSYGDVWLARTTVGTWRAVKVVFRDRFLDSRPYEREFRGIQKFEPLSRSNEGFVDILQIGCNEDAGYFYYVMELADPAVAGRGLERVSGSPSDNLGLNPATYVPKTLAKVLLERARLPVNECLELGITLNLALAHLHRSGLIHRDIKPSNIIFIGGVPKLADIGLVIDAAEARSYVGTEGFIPPEGPTSPQADLYSLGKVLYEAGMGKDRKDFPEPFTDLSEAPNAMQILEFNAILLKACAANLAERYRSAEEMNVDLALLQSGGSVRRQRKLAGQLRFVQRAGAAVTALAALVAAGWLWQARQTQLLRELAAEKTLLAEKNKSLAQAQEKLLIRANSASGVQRLEADDPAAALPWFVEALRRVETAEPRQIELERFRLGNLLRYHPRLLSATAHTGTVHTLAFSPDGRWLAAGGQNGQVQIIEVKSSAVARSLVHPGAVHSCEFSRDSLSLLTACEDGAARLWLLAGTNPPLAFRHQGAVWHATFSTNGVLVLTASTDKTAQIWRAGDGRRVGPPLQHTNPVFHACFSPDTTQIATGSGKRYELGEFTLWDRDTGRRVGEPLILKAPAMWTAFSPDGTRVASSCGEAYFDLLASRPGALVDTASGKVIRPLEHIDRITHVSFSPDGKRLAIAALGYEVIIADARTGEPLISPLKHSRWVHRAVFSPNSRWVASASSDGTARVWDAATGVPITPPLKHAGEVFNVAFDPNGRCLATAGDGGLVCLWDIGYCQPRLPAFWYSPGELQAKLSPDDQWVVTCGAKRPNVNNASQFPTRGHEPVCVLDVKTGRMVWSFSVPGGSPFSDLAISPASDQIAFGSNDGLVQVRDLHSGQLRCPPLQLKVTTHAKAFSPDGKRIATIRTEKWERPSEVRVWSTETGEPVSGIISHPGLAGIEFSPDGQCIVAGCRDGKLRLWEVASCRLVLCFDVCSGEVDVVHFSRDGQRLLTADKYDKTAHVWDAQTGQPIFSPLRHSGIVWDAVFDPAENRILTVSSDMSAAQWNARTGERIDPLLHHRRGLTGGAYDGSGRWIATCGLDQTVRLWSSETGELMAAPFLLANHAYSSGLTKDGKTMIAGSTDGRIQLWDLATTDWPEDDLKRYAEVLSAQSLSPDGRLTTLTATEVASRLKELRAARPRDFELSPEQLKNWHRREKIDNERAGNKFARDFHAAHAPGPDFAD